jgi:hypothetical protein
MTPSGAGIKVCIAVLLFFSPQSGKFSTRPKLAAAHPLPRFVLLKDGNIKEK